MKLCRPCNSLKETSEFAKNITALDGFQSNCKKCQQKYRGENFEKIKLRKAKWARDNSEQERATKKRWKDSHPEQFRASALARKRRWSKTHRPQEKERQLKRDYGLSLADFNLMLSKQAGCCKICELPMRRPQVDHCHSTGKIRGLLCHVCNFSLGGFKDSVDNLGRAIKYLQQ